jgi:hypothetical protein
MNDTEITTPLTATFQQLKALAQETNLLYITDIVALEKLAALNLLQQQSDSFDTYAPEQQALNGPFKQLYNWLHEVNKYFIHRDDQSRIWRFGTYLSRRKSIGC